MAENKILVQIIDHENGNSVLGQDHFESREKAEEFKLKIKSWYKLSIMRTEIPCWDKITLNQEKKQKNSSGSQTAHMANFLVKVKPELPLRSLNANTNHHFL